MASARVMRIENGGRCPRLGTTSERRSTRAADPITVDLCFSSPGCIDLTIDGDDCDDDDAEVVAFTSYMDDGVVCLGERSNSLANQRNSRVIRNRAASRSPVVIETAPIVIDCQLELGDELYKRDVEIPVIKVSDTEETNDHHRPVVKDIICPICLEDHSMLPRMNKQLISTICGHLFCNECIKAAIRNGRCCPTCRKKLTMKQFHPIFL